MRSLWLSWLAGHQVEPQTTFLVLIRGKVAQWKQINS